MAESNRVFIVAAAIAVAFAVAPLPGRWAILQQLLPVLVVAFFYRGGGYSLETASVAAPRRGWLRCAGLGLALAVGLYALEAITVDPLVRLISEQPKDLSLFDPIRGSLSTLGLYLVFMWILAAFGEEFLWRGFMLRQIAERLPSSIPAGAVGVVATATLFGLAHSYQGLSGVVDKFLGGIIIGTIYAFNGRSNIWLVVFVHGFMNTISFVAIYFGVYELLNPGS